MNRENPLLEDLDTCEEVIADVVIETTCDLEKGGVPVTLEEDDDEIPVPPVTIMVEGEPDGSDGDDDASGFIRPTLKRKSDPKFMDKRTVLSLLLESESTLKIVPFGPKIGRNFLLDDCRNFYKGRRRPGRSTFQVDEYTKWDNLSLKKHHYLHQNGRYKYVDYIAGKYQIHQPSVPGEKGVRREMTKLPDPEDILIMRKLYGTLPGALRRRISYIEKFPKFVEPKQRSLILVEYSENFPSEQSLAKSLKLVLNENEHVLADDAVICPDGSELIDDSEKIQTEFEVYHDMQEVLEPIEKTGSDNKGMFFDKNEIIDILLNSETTLEEIPEGPKENEFFIVNNEENVQREKEGKRRLYVDDCGVWKNVSMKRHFYTKIEDTYYYVEYVNGRYRLSNSQLRGKFKNPTDSEVITLRKVYGCLKRDEEYKRRICWIDKFPKGVEPKQKHIALVEYTGKFPKDFVPHGNQKNPNGTPYVRTPQSVMKKMKERVAYKTVKEVLSEFPDMQMSPRQVKQLQNLRYRSTMRVGPGSAKSEDHNDEMHELYGLVQSHPFAQQVIFTKYRSPVVIAYTAQQLNSWKYHCQEKSGLPRVLGVDRTFNIGPVCLLILTYPHPNLQCRETLEQAVMMGPILFHVDKSWSTYALLFNHIGGCLSALEKADVDGISVACKTEEEKPIMDALNRSFPNSTITLCAEHMKMDLKQFLMTELSLSESFIEGIAKEIFGELMTCTEEYDFDTKLINLQSQYDTTLPQFSNYFRKLGENIRHSLWRPTMERNSLMRWSPETCHALTDLVESCKLWGKFTITNLVLQLHKIVTIQEQEELKAIHNEGRYVLAAHARKYHTEREDWRKKTSKQKARLMESMRKIKPGAARSFPNVRRPKQELTNWGTDQQYY